MKKNSIYALMSAIALTGAVGFSSCSSNDDIVDVNPTYNPDTGEVTTNFVFNVATGNTATTRMSSANTQATVAEAFRGIDNAVIMSFVKKTSTTLNDGQHIFSPVIAAKNYDLGTILSSGALDPDGGGATPESRRVIELSLPVETNTMMFWGKAIKTGTDDQQGSISYNVNKDLTQTTFTLNRRIPAEKEAEFKQYEALIAAILNKIINASASYNVTYPTTGGIQYNGTVKWSDYIKVTANGLERADQSPVFYGEELSTKEQVLADAFITLNTIYEGEQRAGSGPTVAKLLGDLYDVFNKLATTPQPYTSKAEAVTATVAATLEQNISAVIETGARTWKTNIEGLKTFSGLDASTQTNLVTGDLNDFPKELFHVPYGAAILKFVIGDDGGNKTFTYSYNETLPTYAMDGGTNGSFNIFNYRYPAELCYFGNSPLRVSTDAYTTDQYPDGVATWEDDTEWAAGARFLGSVAWEKNNHVKSSTRSIAMQENINYGTALLKSTVRYGAATLNDNNAAIQARKGITEADKTITVGAGTFTLTGILIGGAEETVGWNYLPFVNNMDPDNPVNPKFGSFIYDCDLPSTAIKAYTGNADTDKSIPNYTLLWDNWNPANKGAKQNVVYIALEFVNNSGQDFWGMNNMIRNGATFYIAGKLDPDANLSTTDRSAGITWPLARTEDKVENDARTYYALPPYNETTGATIKERRVFMQDYMTEANFVIGENSLHSALVAVPDLRTTQISLGLSVDLKWQTGLSFADIVLGE